jgi:hypothetical protein
MHLVPHQQEPQTYIPYVINNSFDGNISTSFANLLLYFWCDHLMVRGSTIKQFCSLFIVPFIPLLDVPSTLVSVFFSLAKAGLIDDTLTPV